MTFLKKYGVREKKRGYGRELTPSARCSLEGLAELETLQLGKLLVETKLTGVLITNFC